MLVWFSLDWIGCLDFGMVWFELALIGFLLGFRLDFGNRKSWILIYWLFFSFFFFLFLFWVSGFSGKRAFG